MVGGAQEVDDHPFYRLLYRFLRVSAARPLSSRPLRPFASSAVTHRKIECPLFPRIVILADCEVAIPGL